MDISTLLIELALLPVRVLIWFCTIMVYLFGMLDLLGLGAEEERK